MKKLTLLTLIFLSLLTSALAERRMVYQIDDRGLTPYIVDKDIMGTKRVFNLDTGEIGISRKNDMGDTWNLKLGDGRPDPTMDSLLNDDGGE